jgi:type I restriction enzyme R subunit
MQAIARVNRVFRNKPGGLIVDYLGIASELQKAVNNYTIAGSAKPASLQEEAVQVFLTKLDVVRNYFHGFDPDPFYSGTPAERLNLIPEAMEHILAQDHEDGPPDDGKRGERTKGYLIAVAALTQAFALSVPHEDVLDLREEVAFYQAIRAALVKHTVTGERPLEELHIAVKQIVSGAVTSPGIVEIFGAAGLKTPDVSILSDDFLEDVKRLPQKNLALSVLQKLLNDQIKAQSRNNVIRSRSFAEKLLDTILRYQNRTIDGAQVILELIDMAKELRDANQRGDALGLNEIEIAFYDALAENESALDVLGDKQLAIIAAALVARVRENVTVDWTVKEAARAKIRVLVKRILRQFGYPPNLQDSATNLVLEQAELLAAELASNPV